MTNEPSPRPWRVEFRPPRMEKPHSEHEKAHFVDANGRDVWLSRKNAALIVAAVNKHGMPITELVKGYGELEAERDRLRDIVRRLADSLQGIMDAAEGKGEGVLDEALLREARDALGEETR